MFKKMAFLGLGSFSQVIFAANSLYFHDAPLSALRHFPLIKATLKAKASAPSSENQLQSINQTSLGRQTLTRYQQLYKGIPVIGSQVTIKNTTNKSLGAANPAGAVNGHVTDGINLNPKPALNAQEAMTLAKKHYKAQHPQALLHLEDSQLQIRTMDDKNPKLVYQISFKTRKENHEPTWPFLIIDAQTGEVIKEWDNIKNVSDSGPGGNEKTGEYWYGKDDLPSLEPIQQGRFCLMDDGQVRLVNLKFSWDWYDDLLDAYQYPCGQNTEENINGGFSPINDAYVMGHSIIDLYWKWYGVYALQKPDGSPMPLIMRVHFGEGYDNAFWDGNTMSFGDGTMFYPLVSLDVAGHEVSHGFTSQHSGLEYHDESGALNESFSDMAGQASRAYIMETKPEFYKKAYPSSQSPMTMTWGIGETIVKDSFESKALRFMDNPSADGYSADCLDPVLAQKNGGECRISYAALIKRAEETIPDPASRQNFIVHTASGIFNKAFYLLSRDKEIGIKNAFHAMTMANMYYWTPTTDFKTAACDVLEAAKNLRLATAPFKQAFNQVGVDTAQCS